MKAAAAALAIATIGPAAQALLLTNVSTYGGDGAVAAALDIATISPAARALLLTNVSTHGGDGARRQHLSGGDFDDLWCYCREVDETISACQSGEGEIPHFFHAAEKKCCKFTTKMKITLVQQYSFKEKAWIQWEHMTGDKRSHCMEEKIVMESGSAVDCWSAKATNDPGAICVRLNAYYNFLVKDNDGKYKKKKPYFLAEDINDKQYRYGLRPSNVSSEDRRSDVFDKRTYQEVAVVFATKLLNKFSSKFSSDTDVTIAIEKSRSVGYLACGLEPYGLDLPCGIRPFAKRSTAMPKCCCAQGKEKEGTCKTDIELRDDDECDGEGCLDLKCPVGFTDEECTCNGGCEWMKPDKRSW